MDGNKIPISKCESQTHFLSLPPELRLDIYEKVFTFSKTGIALEAGREPRIMERESAINPVSDAPAVERKSPIGYYLLPGLGDILAPLLTCKQVFAEAMPIFYREDSFDVSPVWISIETDLLFARSRVVHWVGCRVTLAYTSALIARWIRENTAALANATGLKRLEIVHIMIRSWKPRI